VIRRLQALAVGFGTALLAGSAAEAGLYSPPPGDSRPVWSPDGSAIVYATQRAPRGLHVIRPDGSDDRPLPGFDSYVPFAFSPDWFWIAFEGSDPVTPSRGALWVSRPDSTGRGVLSDSAGGTPSWSPDGTRIAFVRHLDESSPPDVHTIRVDGSDRRLVAENGFQPRWSPDGSRIAYVATDRSADRWDIAIVNAEGTRPVNVTRRRAGGPFLEPTWSPDGSRLAFVGGGAIGLVRADGSAPRRYAPLGIAGALDWSPDGRRLVYSGEGGMTAPGGTGVFLLDVASGRQTRLAPFGNGATWSPDGLEIVFSGGGRCKDRMGIYRIAVSGGVPVRLTNSCEIAGGERADLLVGSELADVILGRGGDDVLTSIDGYYMGDELHGGAGDDVLTGGFLSNVLEGGPGTDRLDGGPGPDALRGGRGRDTLDGAGGRDVVLAEDGERDTVSCGTNRPSGGRDLDAAFVDRIDRVTSDCELLYRDGRIDLHRGRTAFGIKVWSGNPGKVVLQRRLRCGPAGTIPAAATRACRTLAAMRGAFAPVPPGTLCAAAPRSFTRARIEGSIGGIGVVVTFNRYDDCEVERWNRHRFLFAPR
jgi:Tol biopolymer transport system component